MWKNDETYVVNLNDRFLESASSLVYVLGVDKINNVSQALSLEPTQKKLKKHNRYVNIPLC